MDTSTRIRVKHTPDEELDIISIDEQIKNKFKENKKMYENNKNRLETINIQLKDREIQYRQIVKLNEEKKDLEEKIKSVDDISIFAEYLYLSQKIISIYLELLKKPIKRSFVNKSVNSNDSDKKEKNELISEFLELAKKYIPITKVKQINIDGCECGSNDFEIMNDSVIICKKCGIENVVISTKT